MGAVEFSQRAFDTVTQRLATFLKAIGLAASQVVPASATEGDNLITKSHRLPWYQGPTVLEAIDQLRPPVHDIHSPFLMCVAAVESSSQKTVTVSGCVESGYVCKTDSVRLVPGDQIARVTHVSIDDRPAQFGSAGMIVGLSLAVTCSVVPVGSAIIPPDRPIVVATQFRARVMTFAMNKMMLPGAALVFHRYSVDLPMKLVSVISLVKKNGEAEQRAPGIPANSRADAIFKLQTGVPMLTDVASKQFGRFVIRAKGKSLGCGLIAEVMA